MALDEKLGREITLMFDGSKIGNIVSASLSVDGEPVEIINDGSDGWTESILARKSWNMSLTVHTDEYSDSASVQSSITEELLTGNASGTITLGPETPTTGDVTYTGDVVVTNFSVDKSTDDILESSFEFEGNGQLTRNIAV